MQLHAGAAGPVADQMSAREMPRCRPAASRLPSGSFLLVDVDRLPEWNTHVHHVIERPQGRSPRTSSEWHRCASPGPGARKQPKDRLGNAGQKHGASKAVNVSSPAASWLQALSLKFGQRNVRPSPNDRLCTALAISRS